MSSGVKIFNVTGTLTEGIKMKSVTKSFSGIGVGAYAKVGLTAAQKAGLYSIVVNGTFIQTSDGATWCTFTDCIMYMNTLNSNVSNGNASIGTTSNSTNAGTVYYHPYNDSIRYTGSGLIMGSMTFTFYYME